MKENIPTFMVGARVLIAIGIFLLLRKGTDGARLGAFLGVSVAILLDLTDGQLQRNYGLNPPFADGIGDGSYIIAGFIGIYLYEKRQHSQFYEDEATFDVSSLLILGAIWLFLAFSAYVLPDPYRQIGMALLHIYYVGAGVWLWYKVGKMAVTGSFAKYLPTTAITLAIIVATWDHSRIIDFINGRP